MAIYRLTPPRTEANRWFTYGDHPEVGVGTDDQRPGRIVGLLADGTFVYPGDWILEDIYTGALSVMKNEVFAATYEIE